MMRPGLERWMLTHGTRAEALLALIAARLAVRLALRQVAGWVFGAVPPSSAMPQSELARRVFRSVDSAAELLPGETVCLPRAMAAKAMLARRGWGATLRVGVGTGAQGGLHAHAWLEMGGVIVFGEQGTETVTPLPSPVAVAGVFGKLGGR